MSYLLPTPTPTPRRSLPPRIPIELEDGLLVQLGSGRLALPKVPDTTARLLQLGASKCDARELLSVVNQSPSLPGHVLRVANSAPYNGSGPFGTLNRAVEVLGAERVQEIALVLACHTSVFSLPGHEHELRRVFRHCIAAGVYNQRLAEKRRRDPHAAFLAGFLHDVGYPVALHALLELQKALRASASSRSLMDAAERHHDRAGEIFLEHHSLHIYADIVRHHHNPTRSSSPYAAMMTALADALSTFSFGGSPGDEELKQLNRHPGLAVLAVTLTELEQLLSAHEDVRRQISLFT